MHARQLIMILRERVLYLNSHRKALTCTQFEIRQLFKVEASSFFVKLKHVHHVQYLINTEDMAQRLDRFFTLSHLSRTLTHIIGKKSGQKRNRKGVFSNDFVIRKAGLTVFQESISSIEQLEQFLVYFWILHVWQLFLGIYLHEVSTRGSPSSIPSLIQSSIPSLKF